MIEPSRGGDERQCMVGATHRRWRETGELACDRWVAPTRRRPGQMSSSASPGRALIPMIRSTARTSFSMAKGLRI